MKNIGFSIKKNIITLIFCLFTISLVIFSRQNLSAAKNGLSLWFNSVVPSLLPFFIATELLGYTDIIAKIGKVLNRFMKPIFNVPGIGAYAFIMGIISGYPVGAKIVTNFRKQGLCTKAQCERLIAFTNNSGPLFILGTVGISLFANTTTGFLLLITHILAGILVGFIFRFWKYKDNENLSSQTQFSTPEKQLSCNVTNLGKILSSSISNAISNVVMIGGFVTLFSIIISILNSSGIIGIVSSIFTPIFELFGISGKFCAPFLCGIVELTNGISTIANIMVKNISTNVVLVSFLLGFGGFSILLQVFSIISETDISILPYLLGKILHGSLSALLTYLLINSFPIFNLDLATTYSTTLTTNANIINSFWNYSLVTCVIFIIAFITFMNLINSCKSKCKNI